MERTYIADLRQHLDQTVTVQGALQTLRDQKKMQFIILRDPTGLVQIANWKPNNPELADQISKAGVESMLTVTGKVVDNPVVKLGGIEIQLESVRIDSQAETPLPFDPFAETLPAIDYRMDWRYIDLRRPENQLLFKVSTTLLHAMRQYWVDNHFIEIQSPKLTGSPSESGAELFELPYFETKAYLAQSPQFYKQMGMAAGLERVFEIGPVFRADPSFTSRHMTEFTSIDMEMAWVNSHHDVMDFEEQLLIHAFQAVKDQHGAAIEEVFKFNLEVPTAPFPRIPMAEAVEILKSVGYQLPPEKKGDLDPGGERALGEWVKQHHGHDFFFLTDWPIAVLPFYHMRFEENPTLTKSFDLIAHGLEITTGAQREHRYDVLARQATDKGLGHEAIQYYLDFFRYGCPPHGGLAIGLSRLLMVLLNIPNIRETVYLFRGPTRLSP